MRHSPFLSRLAMIAGCSLSLSIRAGTIVPDLNDSSAIFTSTTIVSSSTIASQTLANGLTLAASFTPDAADVANSSSGPVAVLEIGGTSNGSGFWIINGCLWYLTKGTGSISAVPSSTTDTNGTDSPGGAIGIQLEPVTAGLQLNVYASLNTVKESLLISQNGMGTNYALTGVTSSWNWQGNDSVSFGVADPKVVSGNHGWEGGLAQVTGSSPFNDNTAVSLDGTVALGQVFNAISTGQTNASVAITWKGSANDQWDTSSINWADTGNNPTNYSQSVAVTFDDSLTANPAVNITLPVTPLSMTVNNSSAIYSFSGIGRISGSASLLKSGSQSLMLGTSNDYTGGTTLNGGEIYAGSDHVFGDGPVAISAGAIASDGTTARMLTNSFIQNSDAGVAFGDSINNGALTLGTLNLGGGSTRILTLNSDVIINGFLNNGSFSTKTGGGSLIVTGFATNAALVNQAQGNVIVNGGQLLNNNGWRMENTVPGSTEYFVVTNGGVFEYDVTTNNGNFLIGLTGGDSTANNVLDISGTVTPNLAMVASTHGQIRMGQSGANAILNLRPGGLLVCDGITSIGSANTIVNFYGGTLRGFTNDASFMTGLTNAYIYDGGLAVDTTNVNITIGQSLLAAGAGGLLKLGAGALTLSGANTYTGDTVISAGTLNIIGSLAGGGNVTVAPGATLAGSGVIQGAVTMQAGATLAPGILSGIPVTLTLPGGLSVAGNVSVLVNESLAPSNDLISVSGSLINGGLGTVTVSNAGPVFEVGDTFRIFSQPVPNANSVTILPISPGEGLMWTNTLAVNGTIGIVSAPIVGTPADLANLVLSTGALVPAFRSNIVNYADSVEYTNSSVTVTPTSVDPACTIQIVSSGLTNPIASGSTSAPLPLNPGTNFIVVQVTSADGSVVKDYFISMNRIRPNVAVILADDQGFSDWGCYGSEIKTPNLDSLAADGLRFRNFFNASMCSPTRCALLTGLYTQQAGVDPAASLPMLRTDDNVTIAELLRANGYHTYMSGKWHLGNNNAQLPEHRGFDEVFTYISGSDGGEDEWTPSDYRFASTDGETTNIPYAAGTFYQPDAIGDYCVQFLNNQFQRHPGTPFFLYIPFGSAHYPIQAPLDWVTTNLPNYTEGWDALRYQRYTNMLAQGVIDPRYALSPNEGTAPLTIPAEAIPAWTNLSLERQADLTQRMAIYAAMIQKMDENVGRVIQELKQNGQLNNTIIVALSDNGGNTSGGVYGLTGNTPDPPPLTGSPLTNMGLAGQPQIYVGGGWAHVSNTPFRWYKRWVHKGGIGTPFIVSWPDGLTRTNQWESQTGHLIDIMATIVDITGVSYPTNFTNSIIGTNYPVLPMQGMSLRPWFATNAPDVPRAIGWEHDGNRAYISGSWKFVTKNFTSFDGSTPSDELELHDMNTDPSEVTNVANANPVLLAQMATNWNNWCNYVGDDSYLLLRSITNPPPTANLDPAPMGNDLFVDTFDRPDGTNLDASAAGMWGSCVPPLGAAPGATYYKGYQNNLGYSYSTPQPSIEIVTNALWATLNNPTAGESSSENGIAYNFDTPDIAAAGGFSVEMNIQAIGSDYSDSTNDYMGFGVGLTQAQAEGGADVSGAGSFRGEIGNPGISPFFIDLNLNGNLEVWTNGSLANTVAVGGNYGVLTVSFACAGFTTTNTVTVTVLFDGQLMNIGSGGAQSITFNWAQNNNNYIGMSARATDRVQMDNLAIRKLPLANDLVAAYAMSYGLSGANTAPGADPDGDGVNNFAEWAFGGDPTQPDAYIASFKGIQVLPGNDFMFEFQRYKNYAEVGLQYRYFVSTNLVDWTETTPAVLATSPNEDKADYEVVTMELPPSVTANQNKLFLRIMAESD